MRRWIIIMIVVSFSTSFTSYAADTRTVQAEFDRCRSVMERVERSIKRYEDELSVLKRGVSGTSSNLNETISQELLPLENRLEYFRNRFERSRAQADKIHDELKNVNGPTCPSCVESSVNLYCRSGETLQTNLDEFLGKTEALRNRTASKSSDLFDVNESFEARRVVADSLYHLFSRAKDTCTDKAVTTLLEQARINLAKADSLKAQR